MTENKYDVIMKNLNNEILSNSDEIIEIAIHSNLKSLNEILNIFAEKELASLKYIQSCLEKISNGNIEDISRIEFKFYLILVISVDEKTQYLGSSELSNLIRTFYEHNINILNLKETYTDIKGEFINVSIPKDNLTNSIKKNTQVFRKYNSHTSDKEKIQTSYLSRDITFVLIWSIAVTVVVSSVYGFYWVLIFLILRFLFIPVIGRRMK